MTAQFDSIIVITDRRALDTQIARTIKGLRPRGGDLRPSDNAQELRDTCAGARRSSSPRCRNSLYPDELGDLSDRKFALLIDEAHSSQAAKPRRGCTKPSAARLPRRSSKRTARRIR